MFSLEKHVIPLMELKDAMKHCPFLSSCCFWNHLSFNRQKSLTYLLLLYVYAGADVTEPNSSDSRGERLDFFLKQEEALAAEPGFMGANESEETVGGNGGGTISSVANLKAALMSKNSLLSLRAEMMGDDNPLLYEYLPKGGHSLSCKSLLINTVLNLLVTHLHPTITTYN